MSGEERVVIKTVDSPEQRLVLSIAREGVESLAAYMNRFGDLTVTVGKHRVVCYSASETRLRQVVSDLDREYVRALAVEQWDPEASRWCLVAGTEIEVSDQLLQPVLSGKQRAAALLMLTMLVLVILLCAYVFRTVPDGF